MFQVVGLSLLAALGVTGVLNPDSVAFLINFLPDGQPLPAPVHTAAVYFGRTLSSVDFILPVDTLVTILVLSFNVTILLLCFWLLRWVVSLFRGIDSNRFLR